MINHLNQISHIMANHGLTIPPDVKHPGSKDIPFFLSSKAEMACTHQCHSFRPKISPHWLSELRWLWTSVPWRVACELVSRMGFRILLVQHSQLTPTSLSQLKRVCVFSCNLPPALLAEWLGVFNVLLRITGGRTNTEIRASTEKWLWRRKFHRRSCRTRDLSTTILTLPLSYSTGLVWMLARLLKWITY